MAMNSPIKLICDGLMKSSNLNDVSTISTDKNGLSKKNNKRKSVHSWFDMSNNEDIAMDDSLLDDIKVENCSDNEDVAVQKNSSVTRDFIPFNEIVKKNIKRNSSPQDFIQLETEKSIADKEQSNNQSAGDSTTEVHAKAGHKRTRKFSDGEACSDKKQSKNVRRDPSTSSSSTTSSGRDRETNPEILIRRQKQIDYGKNTVGYDRYVAAVPKQKRTKEHPRTPPKHAKYSRRAWDGLIKVWRQKLHNWDPEDGECEQTVVNSEDDSDNTDD